MDIKKYTIVISRAAGDLAGFFREILRLPHSKKYLLLAIPFTLLFLIFTFPFDVLIRKKILSMENVQFKSVYLDDVEFSFISVIRLASLGITFKDNDELTAREIILDPSLNPYRLFVSNRMKSSVEISSLNYTTNTGKEITGNINGNIDITLNKAGVPESGFIKMILQSAHIRLNEVNLPAQFGGFPLKIPPIKITSLAVDTVIQNKKLAINSIKIAGPDLRGSMTGTISIETNAANSRLNINILIESDSPVISSYKELLVKFTNSEGMIVLPLRGTIQNPVIETSVGAPAN